MGEDGPAWGQLRMGRLVVIKVVVVVGQVNIVVECCFLLPICI